MLLLGGGGDHEMAVDVVAATVAISDIDRAATTLPFGEECDVCNDEEADPESNCVVEYELEEMHKKVGDGASGGWYMANHVLGEWKCGSCDGHTACPFGTPPIEPPGFDEDVTEGLAAALRAADDAELILAFRRGQAARQVALEDGFLVVRRCGAGIVGRLRLSHAQVALLRT